VVNRLNRPHPQPPPEAGLLTSAAAARLLGVGVTAVKRWAESGALPCVKTAGGHRRFRRADIERQLRGAAAPAADPWQEWLGVLTAGGDVHGVLALLFRDRAQRGSWHDVADHLGQLLTAIGDRWASGQLTVAQEHVAASALQRALTLAAETIPVGPGARCCLLAPAEGDEHMIGLALAELCLREHGWRALWMGTHTRGSDIVERVRAGVDMVALSASALPRDRRQLTALVRSVGSACQRAGIPLMLGGNGRWPDPPPFGMRLRSWAEFQSTMRKLNARRS
jgi:excisionase family DNA binding protein